MAELNNENPRLQIFNSNYESFEENPLRSFHNGHVGDSHDQLIFVRNQNPAKWFTNIRLQPVMIGGYKDLGEFGDTGFGCKLLFGRRPPTEEEWDFVMSNSAIYLPDIGSCEAADTFTNHPVWVRLYCPGGTPAQIRESMQLNLTYFVKEVGVCTSDNLMADSVFNPGPFAIYGTSNSGETSELTGYFYPIYLTEIAASATADEEGVHLHTFDEFPGAVFYMPVNQANHAMETIEDGYQIYTSASAAYSQASTESDEDSEGEEGENTGGEEGSGESGY